MRSLALKLTLAFLVVGITGSVVVALATQLQTQQRFNQYVLGIYQSEFVTSLLEYYQTHGSWDGIEDEIYLERAPYGARDPHRFPLLPITVVDTAGNVVYGGAGLSGQQIEFDTRRAEPLEVDGETIGWLVLNVPDRRWQPGTPESEFLVEFRNGILISAAIATAMALLIGILLARTISQPIRELRTATQVVAGGDLGYQVTARTKDELGQLVDSFNQMSADLAHANDLRRQMTADIAHDLRTPLSVILGYTEALSEGKLIGSPEVFNVMHEEAQHLQRLIEDLRTLSLADAGELPLMPQDVSPAALLKRVAVAHQPHAQEKAIAIEVNALPELPHIKVDPDRMAQVLGNLVSNALRYTAQGGLVRLEAARSEAGVTLNVIDTGTGIAAEHLPYVFDRFYRADKSRYLRENESGLGLAIARSIVEAHGGSISVDSEQGKGSIFTITIPLSSDKPASSRSDRP